MKRGGLIARKTRLRAKPKSSEEREHIAAVREQVWLRDGKECVDCHGSLPLDGDVFTRAHMAHTVARWKLGKDYREVWNPAVLVTKCHDCHILREHGGMKVNGK